MTKQTEENKATPTDAPTRKEKRSAAATLKAYRNGTANATRKAYVHSDGYSGLSINCGDAVADQLKMLEPARVMAVAEDVLPGIAKGELAKRYAKLNAGMQRMNSGNRIRAAIAKGTITKAALKRSITASNKLVKAAS